MEEQKGSTANVSEDRQRSHRHPGRSEWHQSHQYLIDSIELFFMCITQQGPHPNSPRVYETPKEIIYTLYVIHIFIYLFIYLKVNINCQHYKQQQKQPTKQVLHQQDTGAETTPPFSG